MKRCRTGIEPPCNRSARVWRALTSTAFSALFFLIAALAASACPCGEVQEPADAEKDFQPAAGLKFSYTPEYKKDFDAAIASARAACTKHLGEPNVAIVSDIDETLFDNREMFKKDPVFNWDRFVEFCKLSKTPVLKPTADLLAWARHNGYAIFLVTGRPESLRAATIENLVKDGVAYDALYMRESERKVPAEQVKVPYREQIEKMGFKIVLNIGDQFSDLRGGHAEDCEKLPNRIYLVK